jgi:hypothetical protein
MMIPYVESTKAESKTIAQAFGRQLHSVVIQLAFLDELSSFFIEPNPRISA